MRVFKHVILPGVLIFVLGMMSCGPSKKIVLDPESRDFYETAQLIMTKEENRIFKRLPDKESRGEFIDEFWAKRDPDPDTGVNEFKTEFYKRIEYANKHFIEGIPGWKTDRGRIFITFGPPNKIEQHPFLTDSSVKGVQLWVYYDFDLAIEFVDQRGNGVYRFDPYSGVYGNFFEALEMAQLGQIFRTEEELRQKFIDFKAGYDPEKKEIIVLLPVKDLSIAEEEGLLKADFQFDFFLYEKDGPEKNTFSRNVQFRELEEKVLDRENISFRFPFPLKPGEYYIDVTITSEAIPESRKIFEFSVRKDDG